MTRTTTSPAAAAPDTGRAPIRVERGTATPEELAALTVLLLSRPSPQPPSRTGRAVTAWRDRRFTPCSWQSV
jgi:hypothetical protein